MEKIGLEINNSYLPWFGFETSPLLVEVHKEPLFEATATLDCTVGYLVIDRLFAFPHYIH